MTQPISPDKIQNWAEADTPLPMIISDIGTLAVAPAVEAAREEKASEVANMEAWLSDGLVSVD